MLNPEADDDDEASDDELDAEDVETCLESGVRIPGAPSDPDEPAVVPEWRNVPSSCLSPACAIPPNRSALFPHPLKSSIGAPSNAGGCEACEDPLALWGDIECSSYAADGPGELARGGVEAVASGPEGLLSGCAILARECATTAGHEEARFVRDERVTSQDGTKAGG